MCESNHMITTRGFHHPSRCLPFHVLLYVKKGTFYLTEDENDYVIPEGTIFFMKAGLHHYGKQFIEAGTEWHFIHFYLEQDTTGLSEYESFTQSVCGCEKMEAYMQLPKQLSDMKDSGIVAKIAEVTDTAVFGDPYRSWYLNQKTAEILNDIAIMYRRTQREATLSDRIAQYLVRHMETGFNAEDVAGEFYLSYKHLAATFKKEKGMSMQQFHTRIRMQKAARILSSTGTPVAEIGEELGFKDALYFSRCFRQMYGMSPSEYRKSQMRGDASQV